MTQKMAVISGTLRTAAWASGLEGAMVVTACCLQPATRAPGHGAIQVQVLGKPPETSTLSLSCATMPIARCTAARRAARGSEWGRAMADRHDGVEEPQPCILDGSPLAIETIVAVARAGAAVRLAPA